MDRTPSDPRGLAGRSVLWVVLSAVGLGIIALAPRCLGLADFYTIDEAYHWAYRVREFSTSLRTHNWAGTNMTGHPGVTTMWLGALGRRLALSAGVNSPGIGDGVRYLSYLRLPLAVVDGLAVVLGYLLLRRLLRPGTALLAAALWALSPFLIAHSRLLHVDALLTSFITLSLLLLLIAINNPTPRPSPARRGETERGVWLPSPRRRGVGGEVTSPISVSGRGRVPSGRWGPFLIASGIFGGLTLLTKGPSLMLPPLVGLYLLLLGPAGPWRQRLSGAIGRFLVWFAAAAVVFVALWPAMWVTPVAAAWRIVVEVVQNGGQPHDGGNFFFGQPVVDPGPLFYPVVVLWRSTPVMLVGLLLLPFALREHPRERRTLLALGGFALLFGLGLTVGEKKLDRYLLPIWPSLEILAAAGIVAAVDRCVAFITRRFTPARRVVGRSLAGALWAIPLVAVLVVGALDLHYHSYYLSYFNPLLGGGAVAERVMLVGWGEGLEQVGTWLSQRPDIQTGPVLSWIPPVLQPFVPVRVDDLVAPNIYKLSSYAVIYERSVQHKEGPVAEAYTLQTPALFTFRRYGIDYASVHQLPRPFDRPVDATFGDGLHLRGIGQSWATGTLVITPSWDIQHDQEGGLFFFVHVLDSAGKRLAQVDLALDDGLFRHWQTGQQFGRPLALPIPGPLPPGPYRIVLGVYKPADGQRLAVTRGTALPESVDGPQTIEAQHHLAAVSFLEPQRTN